MTLAELREIIELATDDAQVVIKTKKGTFDIQVSMYQVETHEGDGVSSIETLVVYLEAKP